MYFGSSAESDSVSLNLFTAAFSPWLKSTNVSAAQISFCSSSRKTICPGRFSSIARISNGCPPSFTLIPFFQSSCVSRSASNGPNRTRWG